MDRIDYSFVVIIQTGSEVRKLLFIIKMNIINELKLNIKRAVVSLFDSKISEVFTHTFSKITSLFNVYGVFPLASFI